MNTPQIIERALRETIREFCPGVIPAEWLHCAQDMTDREDEDGRQRFPQVIIVAQPKTWRDAGATWDMVVTVDCVTLSSEDRDASKRAALFESIEELFDKFLFGDPQNTVQAYFTARVEEHRKGFTLGGFTPDGSGGGPIASSGLLSMTFGGTLHFSLNTED